MAKTKAYVLEDGEVLSKSYMDKYSIKQGKESSQQIPSDKFGSDNYSLDGFVEPLYGLEALAQLLEINTAHYRACKTKAVDATGIGWFLESREGDDGNAEEKGRIEPLLERPNPDDSFSTLFEKLLMDYGSLGNCYMEVVRDPDTREVTHLLHIPAHTIRRHSDEVRFAQVRNERKSWFKRFGTEKEVHAKSGAFMESIEYDENRANEIIDMKNYTSRSDFYGIPDAMPALSAIIGDRERQEYNISFFDNHAVPAYAVTLSGAELDEDTEKKIQQFFQSDAKKERHSTLVLSAQKDEHDPEGEPIEFKFEALSTDTKEASFRMFRQDNRDEILSAHGVPPYRAGIVVEGQLGGSNASETTEIYKQSVIKPMQERIEGIINALIIEQGLDAHTWKFKLNSIDTRDVNSDIQKFKQMQDMAALSPNEVREKMGEEPVEDPAMNQYYLNGRPVGDNGDDGGGDFDPAFNAMKDLHAELVRMATKGE